MIALPTGELPKDEPVGQLGPQDWMAWPETTAVIAALTAGGAEVRFVGGCVRDSLLHRPVKDIDIATPDLPETAIALLNKAKIRSVPTGLAHGTVTAVAGTRHFEITTLRRDVETFGRHARVAYTDDWAVDAQRRDFTINALSCRPDGAVFDYFDGIPDLAAGRIRFVGNATERIEEDVLRLLRYFRFFAHYGKPPADIDALAACRAHASRLATLSGERLCGEMLKLLAAPEPSAACVMMQGEKVLAEILPEARWIGRLRMLSFLETRGLARPGIGPDPLRRLAVLIEVDAARLKAIADRFKLARADAERLASLALAPEKPCAGMAEKDARRLLHLFGVDCFRSLALMEWAAARDRSGHSTAHETAQWTALLDLADQWVPHRLPLQGKDIVDRGIPPGPEVGAMLARLEAWWQDIDFRATREDALAMLDQFVTTPPTPKLAQGKTD